MTRRLRVHVPGGFHHVTLRGNHQQPIFIQDCDRDLLNALVAEGVARYGLRIHAYCWMTNHLHLLVQVSDHPLGDAIRFVAGRYARKLQQSLDTTGHLFERRYHGKFVDADRYFLTLLRYIHRNPVSAGIARDPLDHPWSSHRNYLGLAGQPWVTTDFGLRMLGGGPQAARAAYVDLVGGERPEDLELEAMLADGRGSGVLGDGDFRTRVLGWRRHAATSESLEELIVESCRKSGVDASVLAGPSRARGLAGLRAAVAHEAVSRGIASVSAIAKRLGRSEGALRQLLLRHAPARKAGP
jgi:REP element-mobilizing transposase RayT